LARRRLRPNQEKVRSTTHRRVATPEALQVVCPLDDVKPHMGSDGVSERSRVCAIAVLNAGRVDNHAKRQSRPEYGP
jgi:hypothetical protein